MTFQAHFKPKFTGVSLTAGYTLNFEATNRRAADAVVKQFQTDNFGEWLLDYIRVVNSPQVCVVAAEHGYGT